MCQKCDRFQAFLGTFPRYLEATAKAAAEARLAELNGEVLPEKQGEVREAQEKLRSAVTQFSKLGATKSLFGNKIGRR